MGRFDLWRGYEPEWDNTTHATHLFTNEAVKIIKEHSAANKQRLSPSPMFMYLAHPAPHDPLLPTKEHTEKCNHIPNRYKVIATKNCAKK